MTEEAEDLFTIPTRQKADLLWPASFVVLQAAGGVLTLPVAEVDGYQMVSLLLISDQPVTLVVQESNFPAGPFVQTGSFPSSPDATSGMQAVAVKVNPVGAFMKVLITNTGSAKQKVLQLGSGGYGSAGTSSSSGAGGAPSTSTFILVSADASLPNSRVIAQGANITITDGGPGGTLTISAAAGAGGSLDSAYDFGGPGAGAQIIVDAGPVELTGAGSPGVPGHLLVDGAQTIASAAGATWNAVSFVPNVTLSGAVNITTATGFNMFNLGQPTISSGAALTITNAATMTVKGAPVGGGAGPVTISNAYSFWVQAGLTRLDGALQLAGGTTQYFESLDGGTASVSGAATGRIRYNNGTGTWQVSTQGGPYANITTTGSAWVQGGNSFGAEGILGTLDAQPLILITGVGGPNERIEIAALGAVYVNATNPGVGGVLNGSDGPGWSQAWIGDYNGELRTFIKNSNAGNATLSSYRADNDAPAGLDGLMHYTEFGITSTGFTTNIGGVKADEAFWIQSHCGLNLLNYHDFPIRFSTDTIAAGAPRFGERMRILGALGGVVMGNNPSGGYVLVGSEYLRVTDGGIRSEGAVLVTTGNLTVLTGNLGIGVAPTMDFDVTKTVNGSVQGQIRNLSGAASALSVFALVNNDAAMHSLSLGHSGTGWTASTIFAADEAFVQSSGGVGLNIQATGGYIRFTKFAAGVLTEFARFTSSGFLGIGVGNTAPGNWVDVLDNANGGAVIQTKSSSAGTGALAYFNALNNSDNSLSMGMTSTGFTGAGGFLGADTAFLQTVGSDMKIQVFSNKTLFLQTSHLTRYQIDGDGKMAWFGAATVAQQTAVPDAAGGVVIDTEARAAINALLARMRNYALIAT